MVAAGDEKRVAELIAISMLDPDFAGDVAWQAAVLGDLADAYAANGQFDKAIETAQRGLELDDDEAVAVHLDIAGYMTRSGDIDGAQRLFDTLLEEYGDDEFFYWAGAQVWITAREYQRALTLLDIGARLLLSGEIADHHLTTFLEQRARTLGALDLPDDDLQYALRRAADD